MKEQLELRIDLPGANIDDSMSNVDFIFTGDQEDNDDLKLDFSDQPGMK